MDDGRNVDQNITPELTCEHKARKHGTTFLTMQCVNMFFFVYKMHQNNKWECNYQCKTSPILWILTLFNQMGTYMETYGL